MNEPFAVGDQVALVRDVPYRKLLRAGLQGTVVCTGLEFGWLSVQFAGYLRPHQVRPAHLRLVAPTAAEVGA